MEEVVKLLAPKTSMSRSVTLYPFGPVVSERDSSSILNGSTVGILMSGIPFAKYGLMWWKAWMKHPFRSLASDLHCLMNGAGDGTETR